MKNCSSPSSDLSWRSFKTLCTFLRSGLSTRVILWGWLTQLLWFVAIGSTLTKENRLERHSHCRVADSTRFVLQDGAPNQLLHKLVLDLLRWFGCTLLYRDHLIKCFGQVCVLRYVFYLTNLNHSPFIVGSLKHLLFILGSGNQAETIT